MAIARFIPKQFKVTHDPRSPYTVIEIPEGLVGLRAGKYYL